jgi:hypothetical protein
LVLAPAERLVITHQNRLISIAAALLVALGGLALFGFVPTLMPDQRLEAMAALGGLVTLLIPALVDAVAVERRRRDPTRAAIVDDVRAVASSSSEKRRVESAGGSDDSIPPGAALVILAAVVAAAMHSTGCGSAIGTQARIASSLTITTRAAGEALDDARAEALDGVEHRTEGLGSEARLAALETEADHWRPVGEALDVVREALRTWVATLSLAQAAGDEGLLEPITRVVARVVELYARIAALARELGADVPEVPPEVMVIVRSIGGA